MQRATVDLPEPDSPTMPKVSPACSCNDTSRAASTTLRRMGQEPALYCLPRLRASSSNGLSTVIAGRMGLSSGTACSSERV